MSKFLIQGKYAGGSWARMIKVTDDRTGAARSLVESLGGCLESIYWDVENCTAFAVADLPDSVSAAAVITTMATTGCFTAVEVHELLTQEQLRDVLMLARDVAQVYNAPGSAAIDRSLAAG
jgi:uncharacterized protein with GYD domain